MNRLNWILCLLLFTQIANAQYFGKNKPRYKSFDFNVQESEHFKLYHYTDRDSIVDDLHKKAEQWYCMHNAVLETPLLRKNPVIVYDNHPEFQQTNTINSSINVGTGGVTEGLKNRVVFPFTFTNEQTNHVLGHELVHAFQYNMIINGDSTNIQNLQNIPLWMVEGLAEYMSKGTLDPFTAMWMRSSVLNNDIPSLNDLRNSKYFPYRYGQAFWAFVTDIYGESIIKPLFMNTAKFGLDQALEIVLNKTRKEVSSLWKEHLTDLYTPQILGKQLTIGNKLLDKKSAGTINVSPSISPNGRYLTFWSEKDVLGTNLYMADARTGKIIRKVTSERNTGHLDGINFLESSGTWSPNCKKFAFVGIKKGKNLIVIMDVKSGKRLQEISIKNIPAFTHLAWNPDGKSILFSGLVNGQTDLYSINLKTERITQLTNDPYSEILANFNSDGSKIVYSTDESSVREKRINGKFSFDIAIMDLNNMKRTTLPTFSGADNLNPNFDFEGNIFFLSNHDGFRNIYKYFPSSKRIEQITDLKVGVSGITDLSPALSVSKKRDRIVYSAYNNFEYQIYNLMYGKMAPKVVESKEAKFTGGYLVKQNRNKKSIVTENIENQDQLLAQQDTISINTVPYKPNFKLDFLGGGAGVGVGSSIYGNQGALAGGIQALFSDQLGNHQIFTSLSVNGEILDAGGQVSYLNRKNRIAYGAGITHIPQRTGYRAPAENVILTSNSGQQIPAVREDLNIIRIFNESVNVFAHLPFSTTLRIEGNLSTGYQSFRWDQYQNYYVNDGFQYRLVQRDRERIETPRTVKIDDFYSLEKGFFGSANFALVSDNSTFGMTSPLKGHRYRIGIEQHFGINQYTALTLDARKYIWLKPVSLAIRGTGFYRINQSDNNNVYPFYIGQQGFVRGYGSIVNGLQEIQSRLNSKNIYIGQLIGENLFMTSGEIRLPFTGPKRLAVIPSRGFLIDIALFIDAGLSYNKINDFNENIKPYLALSTGIAGRVNLYGAMIVEPHYAYLIREQVFSFGVNIIPGW